MNVYVVIDGYPAAFAEEAEAVSYAEKVGVSEVHECAVFGSEAIRRTGNAIVVRRHGEKAVMPPQMEHAVGQRPPHNGWARQPQPPPGAILLPSGKYAGPDGSELIVQPGPVPENRVPPGGKLAALPTACRTHGTPLDQHGHCRLCQPGAFVTYEQVQSWPRTPPAQPTPGAENM